MDSAPAQAAQIGVPAVDTEAGEPDCSIEEFWQAAGAESFGLTRDEFDRLLHAVGTKCNHGLPPGTSPGRAQIENFRRALHLQDLVLAGACALGRDVAWQEFLKRFRAPLTRAATAIAGSASAGEELADSLYSEMFGLTERDGRRVSPLASYSGRGSLMGFLRATLAQRNVDRHRRTMREMPLEANDPPAAAHSQTPSQEVVVRLEQSLKETLADTAPEERFMLSAWFLDQRTLLEISRVMGVHEATISRRLQRLTARLHDELLRKLTAAGMSGAAAREALGTEPGDLDINLRKLLQSSQTGAFPDQDAPLSVKVDMNRT